MPSSTNMLAVGILLVGVMLLGVAETAAVGGSVTSAPVLRTTVVGGLRTTVVGELRDLTAGAANSLKQPSAQIKRASRTSVDNVFSSATPDIRPGIIFHDDGETSFRVWIPHAKTVAVQLDAEDGPEIPLIREGDTWTTRLKKGVVEEGSPYRVVIGQEGGAKLFKRDPYARQTDYNSSWCFADNPSSFEWSDKEDNKKYPRTFPPAFDEYVIYELHVGSFSPEGTFKGLTQRLKHIAKLGFTAIQLMPIAEFADAWGYNPRQLLSVHSPYGTPEELRRLVDAAHMHGLAVIVDVVLHHGSVDRNELWEYDGWSQDNNGGIYHEGAPDTEWGRGCVSTSRLELIYSTVTPEGRNGIYHEGGPDTEWGRGCVFHEPFTA